MSGVARVRPHHTASQRLHAAGGARTAPKYGESEGASVPSVRDQTKAALCRGLVRQLPSLVGNIWSNYRTCDPRVISTML